MHTSTPSTTAVTTPNLCEVARPVGDDDYYRQLLDIGRHPPSTPQTDGGTWRRLDAALLGTRSLDDALDAAPCSSHEFVDPLLLGGVAVVEATPFDPVERLAHVGSDAGVSGNTGDDRRDGDFESHDASGDVVVEIVDDGVVNQAEAPVGKGVDSTQPTAEPDGLREALVRLAASNYQRKMTDNCWKSRGQPDVSFSEVTQLVLRNLAKVKSFNNADRVDLTDFGRDLAGERVQ